MINSIYGVITDGRVTEEHLGYRYTDCTCPKSLEAARKALVADVSQDRLGVLAELLINLMRSSSRWSEFVKKYDKDNTYQTELNLEDFALKDFNISFRQFVDWADTVAPHTTEFTRTLYDSSVDRLCNALFSFVSLAVK